MRSANRHIGRTVRRGVLAIAACACVAPALAGGPLFVVPSGGTLKPARWEGTVKVYTDQGSLGALDNATANKLVANTVKQWSSVSLSPDGPHVRILDPHGIVSEYDLATGKLLRASRWTRPVPAVRPQLPAGARYIVDIGNGRIVAAMANGSALMQGGRIIRSEQGIWPSAGGVATIPLLARAGDQMVLWNPLTGERRAIR